MTYALTVTLDASPADAEARVIEALAGQGFGVLSTIDVQATLRAKLGHEMGVYRILGACNPSLARHAIDLDPDIGALLPCNVLLRETPTGGTDVVAADPAAMMGLADGDDEVAPIADEARARLLDALDALVSGS